MVMRMLRHVTKVLAWRRVERAAIDSEMNYKREFLDGGAIIRYTQRSTARARTAGI